MSSTRTRDPYQGELSGGKPHGHGEIVTPDGSKYVGQWRDGRRCGQVSHTYTQAAAQACARARA
jgi:hypothetical protein